MEIEPDQSAKAERQVLEQPLSDEPELEVALVSGQFAADVLAIEGRAVIEDLIAAAPADRLHVAHPEVVSVGSDRVNGLLEADFDFESPSVETDDVQGRQSQVGAQEH